MGHISVDGNDPLAVYLASCEARRLAVEGQKPVLVEVNLHLLLQLLRKITSN